MNENLTKPIITRKWKYEDAVSIARLNAQWGYEATSKEINVRLREFSLLQGHELFIAEINGETAGWLHVCREFSMGAGAYAEIAGLVVDEKHRRKGIAKALIGEAKQWAKENGLKKLKVRTNIKRPEASLVYPKCGLTPEKQQNVFGMEL